jgi:phosphonate transport system permease protein
MDLKNKDSVNNISLYEKHYNELVIKKRFSMIIGFLLFFIMFFLACITADVNVGKFIKGFPGFATYIRDTLPDIRFNYFSEDISKWYFRGYIWLNALKETICIALFSTLLSTIIAFVFAFPSSKNLNKNRVVHFIARRTMELARSVPELVYAIAFVFAFNIGPLPGVLAIALHTSGSLSKLFSEVNENMNSGTIESMQSTGANWLKTIRFSVFPQVLPNYISYSLLKLETNIRSATIVGLVGAGGIGVELMFAIRQFQYKEISALLLMIIVSIMIIDFICEKIRTKLISQELLN